MSWQKVQLGVFLKVREDRFKPSDKAITGLKRVGKIDFSGQVHLSNASSKTDMILVKHGDLLISGINVYKGAVAVYEGKDDITATIHYSSYEFDKKKINIEFLKLFLKSPEFLDAIREQVPGGIKTEIKPKHLLPLEVEIPDLSGQVEIVESFSKFEAAQKKLRESFSYQSELVEQLRQAFLREAMQGKLVKQNSKEEPASELLKKIKAEKEKLVNEKKLKKEKSLPEIEADEVPFEIPSSWAWCRLGEIGINFEYGTSQRADLNLSGIPVLRMNNIQDGKVIVENLKYVKKNIVDLPKLYLENGDILFNRTNSFELVGKSGVYKGDSNAMTFASYLIRIQFSEIFSPDFVNYYINSPICRESQIEPATIQQNGQANFNGTKLKNIITPIPPLAEQHRIVEKLNQLMQLCDDLEKSIQESKTHTGLLLQSALRDALKAKDSIQGCVVA